MLLYSLSDPRERGTNVLSVGQQKHGGCYRYVTRGTRPLHNVMQLLWGFCLLLLPSNSYPFAGYCEASAINVQHLISSLRLRVWAVKLRWEKKQNTANCPLFLFPNSLSLISEDTLKCTTSITKIIKKKKKSVISAYFQRNRQGVRIVSNQTKSELSFVK